MNRSFLLLVAAALSACAGRTTTRPPAPATSDTVTVWVTHPADTLTLHTDSLAHLLDATVVRWRVADTTDAAVLVSRGEVPLVAHGPFRFAAGVPPEGVSRQPLPWGRLYALVSDSVIPIPALGDSSAAAAVRSDLAQFAVTTDVAPSVTSPPLPVHCDSLIVRAPAARPRIAYLTSDSVARQIAERLAALAGLMAAPLDTRELGWALSDGREAGVVVAFQRVAEAGGPAIFCDARITPLVETRATLILKSRP